MELYIDHDERNSPATMQNETAARRSRRDRCRSANAARNLPPEIRRRRVEGMNVPKSAL
jgi:hypothetical protein